MAQGDVLVPLGKLVKVRVRDAWPDEARHFTPWLANEGLAELSSELGFDLKIIRREHAVGRYSLDILAAPLDLDGDEENSNLVVIENQFGSTDHDHLGKLMTYASGVGTGTQGAKTVIWISEDFREEHQRALEWLNEVTQSDVRFYGVQLELYRIGNSDPAPSLNVLVRPNEVVRARRQEAVASGESERNLFYVEYWTAFKEYCVNHESSFRLQSPRPGHYIFAALGRAGVNISFVAARRDEWVGCELYIVGTYVGRIYGTLEQQRASIDAVIPGLSWGRKDGVKSAKISIRMESAPGDRSLWPSQHAWLMEKGNLFLSTFAPLLRE